MSQMIARQVLDRMNHRETLISVDHVASVMADLQLLSQADATEENKRFEARKGEMVEAYGFERSEVRKPFAFSNGIAVIPVHGSLINRFGASWGSVTGYNFIRAQMNAALVDDDVTGIVLDVNSYGGECAGCFELADDIFEMRGKKPIMAMVDSNAYSAAYAIASAADKIVLTPTGGAGSIGVVAMHVNLGPALEKMGVEVSFIYAGKHKVDGNPYEGLSDDVRADIQRGVDRSYDRFVSTVARNRGLDAQVVRDTEARTYRAEDAQDLGLIDAVASPSKAVSAFFNELQGSDDEQEMKMDKDDTAAAPAVQAQASAEGADQARSTERARISAILNCEEAKGNESLANHLAFATQLSVDEAKGMLSASKPAAAAQPAAQPAQPAATQPNAFKQAMDADQHPNLGADGTDGGEDEESAAQFILKAQAAATGRTLN